MRFVGRCIAACGPVNVSFRCARRKLMRDTALCAERHTEIRMKASIVSWPATKRRIKALPVYRRWYLGRAFRRFLDEPDSHLCFGVFKSFDQARAWLPKSKEFDDEALAEEFVNVRTRRIFAYDYPMIYWLNRAINEGARSVLDIGGSVGVHFIAYQRYIAFPTTMSWQVIEVPAMTRIGRDLAKQEGLDSLTFTDSAKAGDSHADIWLSAGAIHYIEDGHPDVLLRETKFRPRYVLLNKLPLYDGEDFVSTQVLAQGSFAPLYVYNRARLVERIQSVGYSLVDEWQVPERSFFLPGHPDKSFGWYSGLCFISQRKDVSP